MIVERRYRYKVDTVNRENGYTQDVAVKARDNAGVVIGAAVAGFAVGGLFGAFDGALVANAWPRDSDQPVE